MMTDSKNTAWLIPVTLCLVCLATRLLFVGHYLEGWDSVNFALALREFDIAAGQPHFPGYPVYVFSCRLMSKLLGDGCLALTVTGALFSSLTILPFYGLARRMFSRPVGILAAALFVVNPLLWLQAEKAYSDSFGLFFVMVWAYLLFCSLSPDEDSERPEMDEAETGDFKFVRKKHRGADVLRRLLWLWRSNAHYFSGLFLGLALGVRFSYFPFLLTALLMVFLHDRGSRRRQALDGLYGLILGTALWLVPLLAIVGGTNLWALGVRHLHGHFYEWGGTLAVSVDLLARLEMFFWDLFANGMGFWWPDTALFRLIPTIIVSIAVILYAGKTRFESREKFIVAFLLPYSLWIFCGQNLNSPRHFLPLLPLLLILIATGVWQGLRKLRLTGSGLEMMRLSISALLVGATGLTSLGLVRLHKNTPPTRVQLVHYVLENFAQKTTVVYCWNTKRLFEYYAPDFHVSSKSLDTARVRQAVSHDAEIVLVTSDHPDIKQRKDDLEVLKMFRRDRYVHNWFHELNLYAFSPGTGSVKSLSTFEIK